jgi:hypothetical protein
VLRLLRSRHLKHIAKYVATASARPSRSKWIAIILIMGTPASAVDHARLDRCQARLGACYESCKSHGTTPNACNEKCTTDQCGLWWKESYGAFIDRMIEENAARAPSKFIGLNRMKGRFHPRKWRQRAHPARPRFGTGRHAGPRRRPEGFVRRRGRLPFWEDGSGDDQGE